MYLGLTTRAGGESLLPVWQRQLAAFGSPPDLKGARALNKPMFAGGKQIKLNFARELGEKPDETKVSALARK